MTTYSVALMAPVSDPSMTAGELGSRLRTGDQAAMAELYRLHGTRIYNYCYRRTASWSEAEDLTSDTFLTAWRTRARVPGDDEGLLPWLYAIATNVIRNHQRSRRRGASALTRIGVSADDQSADDWVAQLDAEERLGAALARLRELPQDWQDVFHLVVWEELSYEQAAATLHCPVGTVRSRLSRVRQALRLTDEVSR